MEYFIVGIVILYIVGWCLYAADSGDNGNQFGDYATPMGNFAAWWIIGHIIAAIVLIIITILIVAL